MLHIGVLCYFILLIISLSSFTNADDKSVMSEFLTSLTPPPTGWSSSTSFCTWSGVKCDGTRVTSINLQSQSLSGKLPSTLNSLTQLTTLSLQSNQLSGPLPSFANLSSLTTLMLNSNNFTSVSPGAFAGLTSLETLSISDNTGIESWQFPEELTSSTGLANLYASNVGLTGTIPDVFGKLGSLQDIRLSYNALNGSLPESFNGSSVQHLWLNNQAGGLSGDLHVLSTMTSLTQVWLHANKFTGQIPDLSECTSIFDLQLRDNQLTGPVPKSVVELPNLKNVTLQNNKLQGPVPAFPKTVEKVELGLTTNSFCRNEIGDCDPQVSVLLDVAGALGYPIKLAENWKLNDACNGWTFVTCDSSQKVITVTFANQGFSGTISPALANLTSLKELYLNNNNLTGTVPPSLATLPQLKKVDVSNNDITGKLPVFKSGVVLLTTGNKNIGKDVPVPGGSPQLKKGSFVSAGMVVGVVITVLVSIILVMFVLYKLQFLVNIVRRRKPQIESQGNEEPWESSLQLPPDFPVRFPYKMLSIATGNFNPQKKLGVGGFGSVFEGCLRDNVKVAVKRLDNLGQGRKEFVAEVRTIGCIHHFNLVKLVGFCAENKHRLLVYEHMKNGSLDKWIFSKNRRGTLTWDAKKNIIIQIAKGLAYLHEDCQKRILHLDVKPQNVLLDDEFNAKLSDFGLAKLLDRNQSCTITQMRGTQGHLAPEWLGRMVTEKADVYSYGVVAWEILFERKNLDYSEPEERTLIQIVTQKVERNYWHYFLANCSEDIQRNRAEIKKILKLAVWCLHTEPSIRPSMSMAVKVLEGSMALEAITDYSTMVIDVDGNPATEGTTLLTASVLSGPR